MKRALLLALALASCQSQPRPPDPAPAKNPIPKSRHVMIVEGAPRAEYQALKRWLTESEEWGYEIFVEAPDGSTQWESDSAPSKPGLFGKPVLTGRELVILGDVDPARLGDPAPFLEYVRQGGTLVMVAGPSHNPKKYQATAWSRILPCQTFSEWTKRTPVIFNLTTAGENHPICRLSEEPKTNREMWEELGSAPWFVRSEIVKVEAIVVAEIEFEPESRGVKAREPLITILPFGSGKVLFLSTDELQSVKSMITGRLIHKDLWRNIFHWAKK